MFASSVFRARRLIAMTGKFYVQIFSQNKHPQNEMIFKEINSTH